MTSDYSFSKAHQNVHYNAGRADALTAEKRLAPSAAKRRHDSAERQGKTDQIWYWMGYLSVVER